jgi:sulfotransferase family protein
VLAIFACPASQEQQLMTTGPDFIIIGAMKSGTSSLFSYICKHPSVLRPTRKELHYYDRRRYEGWGLGDYLACFPARPPGFISGEATPYYIRQDEAPASVAKDFPDVKLIAVLRDPVGRAYSHYWQRFIKGKETRTFRECIMAEYEAEQRDLAEPGKTPADNEPPDREESFLSRGRYAEQLSNWLNSFPAEQLHILFSADLIQSANYEMAKIFSFLQIADVPVDTSKLIKKRSYPNMPSEDRQWLEDYFRKHDDALAGLLGRNLPWRNGPLVPTMGEA